MELILGAGENSTEMVRNDSAADHFIPFSIFLMIELCCVFVGKLFFLWGVLFGQKGSVANPDNGKVSLSDGVQNVLVPMNGNTKFKICSICSTNIGCSFISCLGSVDPWVPTSL